LPNVSVDQKEAHAININQRDKHGHDAEEIAGYAITTSLENA
jgi:hypothetical protein